MRMGVQGYDAKSTRIVVVGAGAVGAATAYTLMLRRRCSEIVLIDTQRSLASGHALDMNHGLPFVGGVKVWAGDYPDCAQADIIIVTAGVGQRPGETRQDLLAHNVPVMVEIVDLVTHFNQNGILLIATNPVDVLSYVAWMHSGFPAHRVIGSGTVIDSARFCYFLGWTLGVDPRSVHASIVGEHGDTELPLWSQADLAGSPIPLSDPERTALFGQTRDAAYEVIHQKGNTCYAIALVLDRICAAILDDERAVLNVSTHLPHVEGEGMPDVYLGVPCVVGRGGVERILELSWTREERERFRQSAAAVRERIEYALAETNAGRENSVQKQEE